MLKKNENKLISDIFKDEDFELDVDLGVEEDELDNALNEILGLKETLTATKPEPSLVVEENNVKEEPEVNETSAMGEQFSFLENYPIVETETKEEEKKVEVKEESKPVATDNSIDNSSASEELNKILEEISNIKDSLVIKSLSPVPSSQQEDIAGGIARIENEFAELKNSLNVLQIGNKNNFVTEIINQLVKIKKLIGSDNIAEVQLNNELSTLYLLEQKASKYIDSDNISFLKKFEALDEFVQKLKDSYNYDIEPLIVKANELLSKLADQKLTKDGLSALETYLSKTKNNTLSLSKIRDIENYLLKVERLSLTIPERVVSMVGEILFIKQDICINDYNINNDERYREYVKICETLKESTDKESIVFLRNRASAILSNITSLKISDVYSFEKIVIKKDFKVLKQPSNKSIYETLNELKNIISSGGMISADDDRTGIASDISYIKEKLEIIQSERNSVKDEVVSVLTLESVIGQLDRLFDDIKNIVDALESNVMDNLAIINDNVNIIKESIDKTSEKISALNDKADVVHEIKEIVSFRYADDNGSTEIATLIDNQNDMINTLLSAVNLMQEKMDRMSEDLEYTRRENKEIKSLVESLSIKTEKVEEEFDEILDIPSVSEEEYDEESEVEDFVDSVEENETQTEETPESVEEVQQIDDSVEEIENIIEKIDDAIAGIK